MIKDKIRIYTDGAYSRKNNIGGCAFLAQYLIYNQEVGDFVVVKEADGSRTIKNTTSNRMELQAIIDGLNFIKHPRNVEIISDATYCTDTINRWLSSFIKDRYRLNYDLMIKLHEAICRMKPFTVTGIWVRGHCGNEHNERVNELAQRAAGTFKEKKCRIVSTQT